MPYNPSSDFVGLWRAISGGVEKGEMPGLDFVVQALARAGLLRVVTSQTAPAVNQTTTAWFRPLPSSFSGEGTLFLWDPSLNMYVPATPELFHGGSTGGGGSGGDGGGDGGNGGTGDADMATVSPTQPSNPATGQQWWDGSVMHIWNGTAWQNVGGGTTSLEFAITQTNDLTFLTNTWTIMNYTASPQIDTHSGWDSVTKKFTPKKAGIYAFMARALPSLPAGAYSGGVAILKNDDGNFDNLSADIVTAITNIHAWTAYISAVGFALMNGTTDYVRVFGYSSHPTAPILLGTGSSPAFSAVYLP